MEWGECCCDLLIDGLFILHNDCARRDLYVFFDLEVYDAHQEP